MWACATYKYGSRKDIEGRWAFQQTSVGWTHDVTGSELNLLPSISGLRISFDKTTWDWTTWAAIVWMVHNDRKNISRITEERE